MNRPKGFSLIELLVVIAIIGLLSTMAMVSLNDARAKARDSRRMSDMNALRSAVELYKNDNTTTNDSAPQVKNNASMDTWDELSTVLQRYLPSGIPNDPGGNKYIYCSESSEGNRGVFIVGAVLETKNPTQGDIDGAQSEFATDECLVSDGSATAAPINCDDTANNLPVGTLYGAAQNAFCLGYIND